MSEKKEKHGGAGSKAADPKEEVSERRFPSRF